MNYKRIIATTIIIGLFLSQIALFSCMEPIKCDGRYYYDEQDTHEHINLEKALFFLRKMLFSHKLIDKLFFDQATEKKEIIDPVAILQPTQTIPEASSIEPKLTWVGHATFFIQMNGFNILTDPIFGPVKVGPFTLSKRIIPSGIELDNLPKIDIIVISHNHPDHMDTETLKALAKKFQPMVFVPEGNKELVESMGFEKVFEENWWDEHEITTHDDRVIKITCLPAYHWSARFSLSSYRKALWSSWMISTPDKNIYFAGDTAYGKHFKQIAAKFPSIDIALMPISPTAEKENSHKHSHVDAPEAVDAFIDLNAHCFIPMHYGTFSARPTSLTYPINKLHASWKENSELLAGKKLLMARCGQEYKVDE
jgi:L-ascorbate metabolism protein UlaG (beta-lactamase superfamily)